MNLTSWLTGVKNVSSRPRPRRHERGPVVVAIVESLESRTMLSAAPVVADLGPNLKYTEGAPPVIVAAHASITDGAGSFANSSLTVTTTNGAKGDQLGILQGNGVGVGPNGEVMYASSPNAAPAQIGSGTGGKGNTPLTIEFNQNATQASVQAVLDQIGYGNGTSTFAIPDRSIQLQFTDGTGATSATVTKMIHVTPAPVVNGLGAPLKYVEGAPPIPVALHAQIGDAPNAYQNSSLTVGITNGMPGDQLGITKGAGVGLGQNGDILFSSSPNATPILIGKVTGGAGSTPLTVKFNANATQQSVQAVLNQVVYGNGMSTMPTPDRNVSVVFTDGNKVPSVPAVQMIHVAPAPVIDGLNPAPVTYSANSNPIALAPKAIVADAPGAYANSSLTVQLKGGDARDQLSVQANGGLSIGANDTLIFNGVTIGMYSGGSGSQALSIAFNSSATHDAVQAVLQNIVFSYNSNGGSPNLNDRVATFTFTDGNHVASFPKLEGIHVTS